MVSPQIDQQRRRRGFAFSLNKGSYFGESARRRLACEEIRGVTFPCRSVVAKTVTVTWLAERQAAIIKKSAENRITERYQYTLASISFRSVLSVTAFGLSPPLCVPGERQTSRPPAKAAKPAREPGLYMTITTSMGTIVAKLFDAEAPKTVKNISDLAMGPEGMDGPENQ